MRLSSVNDKPSESANGVLVVDERGHNQQCDYAGNWNERSICHISNQIISATALSKYLTKANKWKIIAKCPGTLNQCISLFERILALY